MRVVESAADVRGALQAETGRLGLVPTMGALHAGHEALIRRSTAECDTTAMSLFVNPTQFNDTADLAAYPRDLERDLALAADLGPRGLEHPQSFSVDHDVENRLRRMIQRDEEDVRVLSARKQAVSQTLRAAHTTGRALTAYREPVLVTPGSNILDESSA